MFVRVRNDARRLQLSVVETRRVDGKVHHAHIGSLGSILTPFTIVSRIEFWRRLHERLGKLSNRIGLDDRGRVLGAVHERIPMPTPEEQRTLQFENARADADLWSRLRDIQADMVAGSKAVAADAERKGNEAEAAKKDIAEHVEAAKRRIQAIERGETVHGGIGKPVDVVQILRGAGWTLADIRHADQLATLCEVEFDALLEEGHRQESRSSGAASRSEAAPSREVGPPQRWSTSDEKTAADAGAENSAAQTSRNEMATTVIIRRRSMAAVSIGSSFGSCHGGIGSHQTEKAAERLCGSARAVRPTALRRLVRDSNRPARRHVRWAISRGYRT